MVVVVVDGRGRGEGWCLVGGVSVAAVARHLGDGHVAVLCNLE